MSNTENGSLKLPPEDPQLELKASSYLDLDQGQPCELGEVVMASEECEPESLPAETPASKDSLVIRFLQWLKRE